MKQEIKLFPTGSSLRHYLWQWRDEGVYVGLPGRVHDLVHGDVSVVVAVRDVLGQRSVEENGLLWDDAHARPDHGNVEALHVLALKQLRVVISSH